MTVGERIRNLREMRGLTGEQLGVAAGLQKSAIAKYENGRIKTISLDVIEHFAAALNVAPATLAGWDTNIEGGTCMQDAAFTVERLAQRWCCSTDIIYDLLRTRELKGFKIGKAWRISAAAVDRFENKEEMEEQK